MDKVIFSKLPPSYWESLDYVRSFYVSDEIRELYDTAHLSEEEIGEYCLDENYVYNKSFCDDLFYALKFDTVPSVEKAWWDDILYVLYELGIRNDYVERLYVSGENLFIVYTDRDVL